MRLLGKKLKVGLLIMALLSFLIPKHINALAVPSTDPTNAYYTKNNLEEPQGSYLTEATMLVYDEILRYQRTVKFTNGLDEAAIAAFDYDDFEANVRWFMDELVGMESDWIQNASPGIEGNTAYGYVQFTEDSVKTAVNRYIYHIEKFNSRSILGRRDWQPRGFKNSDGLGFNLRFSTKKHKYRIEKPDWLRYLMDNLDVKAFGQDVLNVYHYEHERDMDYLTYDQMLALAFVHLHGKNSKDYNFVQLAKGDIAAAKELYKNNHHTDPDAATLARMEKFFQKH